MWILIPQKLWALGEGWRALKSQPWCKIQEYLKICDTHTQTKKTVKATVTLWHHKHSIKSCTYRLILCDLRCIYNICTYIQTHCMCCMRTPQIWVSGDNLVYVLGSKLPILGMVIPPLMENPYNGYIKPYCWVDDHPLRFGRNNGSLDPGTYCGWQFYTSP